MDVLELPRPVINFLRTMAKEGCRYVLSWDIFGGNDAITLTLTWKSNENEENDGDDQSQLLKTPLEQVNDELNTRRNDSTSSPRRSRRDETTTAAAIFRSSRGKSLENPPPNSHKPILSHPSFISSLERSSIITREKKESDPIYANLSHLKYPNNSSPSRNHQVSSNYQRAIKQPGETSILRKVTPIGNESYSKLKRMNVVNRTDEDDDETSDPWIKRLDQSIDNHTGKSDDEIAKSANPSGKVKFKRKPDYF